MVALQMLSVSAGVTLILILVSLFFVRRPKSSETISEKSNDLNGVFRAPQVATALGRLLASALPDSVILPHQETFTQLTGSYWAQQECEVVPACVVRPRDVSELCKAVTILKQEYDERVKQDGSDQLEGLFAVRSGGHSPIPGAASIRGGVLIDMSLFREVNIQHDGRVIIGTGAKWMDVSKVLDERGMAVIGGRNSAVGVGGLTLGGGLSFFAPRFGFVCSNIISYEVVLASGVITTASAVTNPDLWRALKGGSNNFGIVTRFTVPSFPSTKIWSGFIYILGYQAAKAIAAFHGCVNKVDASYDDHAAGPLICFSHVQQLGFQVIAVNLVYTKLSEDGNKWPKYWQTSSFNSLWRLWSTCKVRTLTSATDELHSLNAPGRRQVFATTTIKNDSATLTATYGAYNDAIASLRRTIVKGLVWTLVLQPLLSVWARKGDPNVLGLHEGTDDPLVIVSFTINWHEQQNDDLVKTTLRRTIDQIDAFAMAHETSHRYRYLNYCAEWQRPFVGYGHDNLRFLKEVSRKYDPDCLFQRGCVGGFKLEAVDGEV